MLVIIEQCYYRSVKNVEVKNQDSLKNQEAKGLQSNLGIGTPLSKVPIFGDILF